MKKSPLQQVKDKFGGKDKLVAELIGLMARPSELTKDQFKKKLLAQSNRKLMILHQRETTIKSKYASRSKLIDSLVSAHMGKQKKEDKGYRMHLENRSTGQLLDLANRLKV